MEYLTQVVYQVSTAMLAPVLTALLAMFGWSLFALGALLREWRLRYADAAAWRDILQISGANDWQCGVSKETCVHSELRRDFVLALRGSKGASLEKSLADMEVRAAGRLAWMSFGVRTGPLLGLMGTLIPMGPALVGLSTGDIESLARNLVIVFSTTIVGVLVGGLCFAMLLVRRQWYAQDLADFAYLVDRIAEYPFHQINHSPRTLSSKEPSRA